LYEHVKDAKSSHDSQTLDVATDEQQTEQAVPNREEDPESGEEGEGEDVEMRDEKEEVRTMWMIVHVLSWIDSFIVYCLISLLRTFHSWRLHHCW
jgi:hypothetical protein